MKNHRVFLPLYVFGIVASILSVSGCSMSSSPPFVSGPQSQKGTGSVIKPLSTLETAPASGCNFYSDGDVLCSQGCQGSETPQSTGYIANMTCSSGSSSFSIGGSATVAPPPSAGAPGGGIQPISGYPVPTLTYAERIYNEALALWKIPKNTRGLYGVSKGNECVAVLQYLLKSIGLAQIDVTTNNPNGTAAVSSFATFLVKDGYTSFTNEGSAAPGDFVELTDALGGTHFGVYLGNDEMISNSSASGTFSWYGTVEFEGTDAAQEDDNLAAGTPVFFHHK